MSQDLNLTKVRSLRYPEGILLEDYHTQANSADVAVYFRHIREHLIEYINEADAIVGNIAWLTELAILEALTDTEAVAIVIQKRDLLRKDLGETPSQKRQLIHLYMEFPKGFTRADEIFQDTVLYCEGEQYIIDPIRVIGYKQKASGPKAHNKFLVFCRRKNATYEPYAVWTGSFNFTKTSVYSFENAVVISHPEITRAYFSEFAQLELLSEPMFFTSFELTPQWQKENG